MEYYTRYDFTTMPYYKALKATEGTIVMNEGTDKECIFVKETAIGCFHIASVSRADFEGMGFDTSGVTDGEMEYIAKKMSDSYCENGFWGDIRFWAEKYEMPRINKEEE